MRIHIIAVTLALAGCVDDYSSLPPVPVEKRAFFSACRTYLAGNGDAAQLRSMGLTARDVELMGDIGSGQTFRGLECSTGYAIPVNASYAPGAGHEWQAVLNDFGPYAYLKGDGTESGMQVYGWN